MSKFSTRLEESSDKALKEFMLEYGIKTKNGAIEWLVNNGMRLRKNDEILCRIIQAEQNLASAKEELQEVQSPNLDRYHY